MRLESCHLQFRPASRPIGWLACGLCGLGLLAGCGPRFTAGQGGGGGTGGEAGGSTGTLQPGEPCDDGAACRSSYCVEGVCCEEACDAECFSCALEGSAGTCTLVPPGVDPRADCDEGGVCDGTGSCARGDVLWSAAYGQNGQDFPAALAVDSAGSLLATGQYVGPVTFGTNPLPSPGDAEIFLVKLSATGEHQWSRGFGGTLEDHGLGVATDAEGNVMVAGGFRGSVGFGGPVLTSASESTLDVYLAKLDPAGDHVWSQRFGDVQSQEALDVAVYGTDHVVVAGNFQGTVGFGGSTAFVEPDVGGFVAAFDGAGAHRWSTAHGGTGASYLRAVAIDPSGIAWVAGDFVASVTVGGAEHTAVGAGDTYLCAFDLQGSQLLSLFPSGDGDERSYDVAVDAEGNVLVTGVFDDTIDFGGNRLATADGKDGFVAKVNASGVHVWSRPFGGTGDDYGSGVAVDAAGNVFVTGGFTYRIDFGGGEHLGEGDGDIFVVKLAPDGTHLWTKTWGPAGSQSGYRLATDAEGRVFFGGLFTDTAEIDEPYAGWGEFDVLFALLSP